VAEAIEPMTLCADAGKHTGRYGIMNFRVITVTPTRQRALNLCQKLQKAERACKRFLFTDLDSVSPGEPARILEKVFLTTKDFEEGTLYSFLDQGLNIEKLISLNLLSVPTTSSVID
jgi:hypothetical protein